MVYLDGNQVNDARVGSALIDVRIKAPDGFKFASAPLFDPSNIRVASAETAFEQVLNFAGAIFPKRDAVDARVVDGTRNGTGRIIDSQNQVGGWPVGQGGEAPLDSDSDGIPDAWESAHGLNPNSDADANNPARLSPNGYSWLEEYVNSLIPAP